MHKFSKLKISQIIQQKINNSVTDTETYRKEGRYTLPYSGDSHTSPHAGQLQSTPPKLQANGQFLRQNEHHTFLFNFPNCDSA